MVISGSGPQLSPLLLSCRCMQLQLPALQDLDVKETPHLAQLHLSSASNMMQTIRLVAPSAFVNGSASPDHALLLELEGSQLQLVTCLIEL